MKKDAKDTRKSNRDIDQDLQSRVGNFESGEFQHPSFGLVQIRRVQGNRRLFASSTTSNTFFQLTIRRAILGRSDTRDATHQNFAYLPICEAYLSPSQYVELLTTNNVGDGVPCTLAYVDGAEQPPPPELPSRHEVSRDAFVRRCEKTKESGEKLSTLVLSVLDGKVGKKTLDEVRRAIETFTNDFAQGNLPFLLADAKSALDDAKAEAKAEIDAYVANVISTLGLKALANLNGSPKVQIIDQGSRDDG